MDKNFFASKTVWVQIMTFIISLIGLLQGQEWISQNPVLVGVVGLILAILNAVVRFLTNEPVAGPVASLKRITQ